MNLTKTTLKSRKVLSVKEENYSYRSTGVNRSANERKEASMEGPLIKIRSSFWQRWLQQFLSFVIKSVLIGTVYGRSMIFGMLFHYHQYISFPCRY